MSKLNLSLDDWSPHPRAGLNFECVKWCDKIIEQYPDFKVNLFTTAAYCRLHEQPNFLSNNKDWVDRVKALPKNYRINLHGYHHRRTDPRFPVSNNDEFQFLDEANTDFVLDKIEEEFRKVGLSHTRTFRPPGWKLSFPAARALTARGYKIAGDKTHYEMFKNSIPKLNWISYNWDTTKKCKITEGDVVAFAHTSDWTKNYMNEERYNLIIELLKTRTFEFKFIEDM